MKTIYEAVLVRENGGDLDIEEFSTLKNARQGIKRMIGKNHITMLISVVLIISTMI